MLTIVDGHEDLAWNAVEIGRHLTASVTAIRMAEGANPAHDEGTATVSLPAMRAANVRVVLATIFTYPEGSSSSQRPGYRSPDEAFARAKAQIEYYHQLDARGEATVIRTLRDLAAVLAGQRPAPGLVLLMEGADPIRTPDDLTLFVEWGVRAVGLAWKATRYAAGANLPGPLTTDGAELLRAMARQGVLLDASHLAEQAFWQALDVYPGRVIASHANCRTIVPGERQLSDAMIRAVAGRDGMMGLVFYNRFIRPGWRSEDGKKAVGLRDLLPHVAHIARLAGVEHIGLGTDLDGGVGREVTPREIDTVADLPKFADVLAGAGYDRAAVAGIMGENWLRLLRAVLPKE